VLGAPLAGLAAMGFNLRAWLEEGVTPREITADNACTYMGLFRRE